MEVDGLEDLFEQLCLRSVRHGAQQVFINDSDGKHLCSVLLLHKCCATVSFPAKSCHIRNTTCDDLKKAAAFICEHLEEGREKDAQVYVISDKVQGDEEAFEHLDNSFVTLSGPSSG
eukprot:jgi/Chrzof1/12346/Cz06g31100.t1